MHNVPKWTDTLQKKIFSRPRYWRTNVFKITYRGYFNDDQNSIIELFQKILSLNYIQDTYGEL